MTRAHCIRMLLALEPASTAELIEVCGWPAKAVRQAVRHLSLVRREIRLCANGAWELAK